MKRVLVCANPDLNFIDGSSIWAQTITLALAATGEAQVDFIAKSAPQRPELFEPLTQVDSVTVVTGTDPQLWNGKGHARLSLPMMADLAVRLDQANPYDVIVVRGLEIATHLLAHPAVLRRTWLYLTDIGQDAGAYTPTQRRQMGELAMGCRAVLCQSEGFKALWQSLVPGLPDARFRIYSPVVPDPAPGLPPITARPPTAIYAGKFKAEWMTLELAEGWPAFHRRMPQAQLVILGDKIHDEPGVPEYRTRMEAALQSSPGLHWLGAQSRDTVQEALRRARVGISWRAEAMNDTLEYSTKILEYGAAGCGAIINRNPLHEALVGADYPLFANSDAEFWDKLGLALTDNDAASRAADALGRLAARHTFAARTADLRDWLAQTPAVPTGSSVTRVLVAGHDLKFFEPLRRGIEATGAFTIVTDQWRSHDEHDEARSRELLAGADAIFCEWCLGNLLWYSNNKRPGQRLVGRFHLQERERTYLAQANWANIDHIGYVSGFIQREAQRVFGFPHSKSSIIPNIVDQTRFLPDKKAASAVHTLGIIGVSPMRKRLDRALDLLESLIEDDPRFVLRVKGRNPLDYGWIRSRPEELSYYREIFRRINSNPKLRYNVIFDPAGDDVNAWFSLVGFILSPSDFESFHLAIGEGMLTGAVPVVWDWDGAAEIWGSEWVVHSIEEARRAVLDPEGPARVARADLSAMSTDAVAAEWAAVLTGKGR